MRTPIHPPLSRQNSSFALPPRTSAASGAPLGEQAQRLRDGAGVPDPFFVPYHLHLSDMTFATLRESAFLGFDAPARAE